MIDLLRFLVGLVANVGRRRVGLVAENALLRQQLIVAQRKIVGRVRWAPWQRFTMGFAPSLAPAWREAMVLVKPATILRWHRARFRVFCGDVLDHQGDLRRRGRRSSARWPRAIRAGARSAVRGELLKLGIRGCKRTIQKYMRARRPEVTGNAGRPSSATTSRGWATSCRPTTFGSVRFRAFLP